MLLLSVPPYNAFKVYGGVLMVLSCTPQLRAFHLRAVKIELFAYFLAGSTGKTQHGF